jgi:hypothetical protein
MITRKRPTTTINYGGEYLTCRGVRLNARLSDNTRFTSLTPDAHYLEDVRSLKSIPLRRGVSLRITLLKLEVENLRGGSGRNRSKRLLRGAHTRGYTNVLISRTLIYRFIV